MPKIISVTKEEILNITKELINNKKFDELNCRKIASLAGIAVGTIYKFFPSKLSIISNVLSDDWNYYVGSINTNQEMGKALESIYTEIYNFSYKYNDLWDAIRKESTNYSEYLVNHEAMVNQISSFIINALNYNSLTIDDDILKYISESILCYSSRLIDYKQMEKIFVKLIS